MAANQTLYMRPDGLGNSKSWSTLLWSGTVGDQNLLSISGEFTGFPTIRAFDDVENISEYAALNSGDLIPTVQGYGAPFSPTAPWMHRDTQYTTPFKIEKDVGGLRGGRKSVYKATYGVNGGSPQKCAMEWSNQIKIADGCRDFYASWWVKQSWPIEDGSNKLVRIWAHPDGINGYARLSWEDHKLEGSMSWYVQSDVLSDPHVIYSAGPINTLMSQNQWTRLEILVKETGIVKTWVNNVLQHHLDMGPRLVGDTNGLAIYRLGHDAVTDYVSARDNGNFRISDVYQANSAAQIVVGNASTFNTCTQLEPQEIVSLTGSNLIIRQKLAALTGPLWIYQLDSNRNPLNNAGVVLRT